MEDGLPGGDPLPGARAQHDLTALRELHRVRQQVHEHLLEPIRVPAHQLGEAGLNLRDEVDPPPLSLLADQREGLGDDVVEVEGRPLEHEPPGVDLREVQDVVDDREEQPPARLNRAHELELPRGQLGVEQERRHPDDRVHRGADLVAHVGEEAALAEGRGLELERALSVQPLEVGDAGLVLAELRAEGLADVGQVELLALGLAEGPGGLPQPRERHVELRALPSAGRVAGAAGAVRQRIQERLEGVRGRPLPEHAPGGHAVAAPTSTTVNVSSWYMFSPSTGEISP